MQYYHPTQLQGRIEVEPLPQIRPSMHVSTKLINQISWSKSWNYKELTAMSLKKTRRKINLSRSKFLNNKNQCRQFSYTHSVRNLHEYKIHTTSIRANKKVDIKMFCTEHFTKFRCWPFGFFCFFLTFMFKILPNVYILSKTIWNPNDIEILSKHCILVTYTYTYTVYSSFLKYYIFTHKITFLNRNKYREKCQ